MAHGRQIIKDFKTDRQFTVEVIHARNDRDNGDWTNGGIDKVKDRGSIALEDSIITEENGFKNIELLPSNVNPLDRINELLKESE